MLDFLTGPSPSPTPSPAPTPPTNTGNNDIPADEETPAVDETETPTEQDTSTEDADDGTYTGEISPQEPVEEPAFEDESPASEPPVTEEEPVGEQEKRPPPREAVSARIRSRETAAAHHPVDLMTAACPRHSSVFRT